MTTKLIPFMLLCAFAPAARAQEADAPATYSEIKATLGLVPTFLREFPPEAVAAVWDEYKGTGKRETLRFAQAMGRVQAPPQPRVQPQPQQEQQPQQQPQPQQPQRQQPRRVPQPQR